MKKRLFPWLDHRATGVLLHPTSFPGEFGIGSLGKEAATFLDFLSDAGVSYWQICPLGPTGYGDSPYQCFSAFAGNPYLIDIYELSRHDLLPQEELGRLLFLSSDHVDYGGIYRLKTPILARSFATAQKRGKRALPYGDFDQFRTIHKEWLPDYALFRALKDYHEGAAWTTWPKEFRNRRDLDESRLPESVSRSRAVHEFVQYLFYGQWRRLKRYANERGIRVIGDMPIFVAADSADVWASPELFQWNVEKAQPMAVAGCPPDYFAEDGQLWGNPLYDWKIHRETGYKWWLRRFRSNFTLYDVVRLDHFRGFESGWSIPFGAKTARKGKWEPGPGIDFFRKLKTAFPNAKIIAEDLGIITPEVIKLREETGLPGMGVLQFAFGGKADNFYLPHNLQANMAIYPGTHDNNTTLGWYSSQEPEVQDHVRRYLRVSGEEINWDFIRTAYRSVANLAVIPLQDFLNLGEEARLNVPGVDQGNWQWRYHHNDLENLRSESIEYLRELGELYGRTAPEP